MVGGNGEDSGDKHRARRGIEAWVATCFCHGCLTIDSSDRGAGDCQGKGAISNGGGHMTLSKNARIAGLLYLVGSLFGIVRLIYESLQRCCGS
jgi:hypothetical protein